MPRVTVRLFAAHREAAGRRSVEVEVASGATVGDLRAALARDVPSLRAAAGAALVALNGEYAQDRARVSQKDEVALFPPVAGG